MKFTLIFDVEDREEVAGTVLPLIHDLIDVHTEYAKAMETPISEESKFLLYLSDEQIKPLLPKLARSGAAIAVLPHPKAGKICILAGVSTNLKKAVTHLRTAPEAINVDLLYCNERPVFNSVVVGSAFQPSHNSNSSLRARWLQVRGSVQKILNLRPFRIEIAQKDGSVLKTAVSGILVVSNKSDSNFAPFIPGESSFSDGMLHALLICPRSLMELTNYVIRSLFRKNQLPHFGAYIKTNSLLFTSNNLPLHFTEDDLAQTAAELALEVKKKHIRLFPGSAMNLSKDAPSPAEVFKISTLPLGEAANELSMRKLPLIKRASTEEFKDLFRVLRDNARLKNTYMVLMVLSTSLATLGLFANSSPVIIGAMILAPLMAPIISLSMGSLRQDRRLMLDSTYSILVGIGLSFVFAIIITLITPIKIANAEILARTSPNLLDLGVAVISGIAGAYGYAREEVAKTLAGVAIAVALVPPLAVAGIGVGWWNWNVFSGASLLLLTNLAGMVLAAAITFLILGFSPFRLATKALLISVSLVVVFSIPLALGFNRMIYEHKIIQSLDGWHVEQVIVKSVRVQNISPLNLSVTFVSPVPLNDEDIDRIKRKIESRISHDVELEINVAILRRN